MFLPKEGENRMPEPLTLNRLNQDLIFFHKMYDVARLVDPVRKTVLEYRGGKIEEICGSCYAYWKTGHVCGNCISIRAHHENKSYMKLEQKDGEIIPVTAFPVEAAGELIRRPTRRCTKKKEAAKKPNETAKKAGYRFRCGIRPFFAALWGFAGPAPSLASIGGRRFFRDACGVRRAAVPIILYYLK